VASVWRHPESQYWTACFPDENGRQRRISTKETNSKKALKIAEEFESAVKTTRTLKEVQRVLHRLLEEVSGQSVKRTTFRKYLSDWLTAKKAVIDPDPGPNFGHIANYDFGPIAEPEKYSLAERGESFILAPKLSTNSPSLRA
jgi:hypothetical protein